MTYAIVAFALSGLLWIIYLTLLARRLRRATEGR